MRIDTSRQGYEVLYKNKKFKTQKGFDRWLTKTAKYNIRFVDKGQDCLEWIIDERGEVLHSDLQAFVWNGHIVNLSKLKIGKEIGVLDIPKKNTKYYDFVVSVIK